MVDVDVELLGHGVGHEDGERVERGHLAVERRLLDVVLKDVAAQVRQVGDEAGDEVLRRRRHRPRREVLVGGGDAEVALLAIRLAVGKEDRPRLAVDDPRGLEERVLIVQRTLLDCVRHLRLVELDQDGLEEAILEVVHDGVGGLAQVEELAAVGELLDHVLARLVALRREAHAGGQKCAVRRLGFERVG